MNHFFVPQNCIQDGLIVFPDDISRQIKTVLRLDIRKDAVVALDNTGIEYLVQLSGNKGKQVFGQIVGQQPGRAESNLNIKLCYSLTRREKIEWVLQKCTEIGVASFQPFSSSRSIVQDLHSNSARQERLEAIMREAAEQSMRARLPILHNAISFESLVKEETNNVVKLIAWEQTAVVEYINPEMLGLLRVEKPTEIRIVIGPEGGFSREEVLMAEQNGYEQISLGTNILRMETACMAASAISIYLGRSFGD